MSFAQFESSTGAEDSMEQARYMKIISLCIQLQKKYMCRGVK